MAGVFGKLVFREGVDGKQAVVPHVPAGRIAETAGMVQDGDTDRLAVHRAVVIDPFGRLAPAGFLADSGRGC